jgi:hypothetical protein
MWDHIAGEVYSVQIINRFDSCFDHLHIPPPFQIHCLLLGAGSSPPPLLLLL